MKKLLKKLHSLWWDENIYYRGENPACDKILEDIEQHLRALNEYEILAELEIMTQLELEEILPVLDNLSEDYDGIQKFINIVMN